ncbi:MAG: aggregation factor core protein MAFp3 isoform E [Puniceicoccaceae bacterium 5H]|nr:MAG: aggregation factor core protein MAFp3 isoform E [Puniceicoccaceae bacterium 5H]
MKIRTRFIALLGLAATTQLAAYGPYPRQAPGLQEWEGTASTAIPGTDANFAGWASRIVTLDYGTDVADIWKTEDRALGPSVGPAPEDDPYHDGDSASRTGGVYEILCIGRGGEIVLGFDQPFRDGAGWDLAVFENSFNDEMLELAYVEVSSDGVHFVRFPSDSLTASTVGAFGRLDARDIDGLAGKYRIGYGTPFDLEQLRGLDGSEYLDFEQIRYVKIVDVVGDGNSLDSDGDPIYDPYPVSGSAGFDLEAVGYIHPAQLQAPSVTLTPISGTSAQLTWQGQIGMTYTVQSWDGSSWSDVTTVTADATGAMSADVSLQNGQQSQMFRVLASWATE